MSGTAKRTWSMTYRLDSLFGNTACVTHGRWDRVTPTRALSCLNARTCVMVRYIYGTWTCSFDVGGMGLVSWLHQAFRLQRTDCNALGSCLMSHLTAVDGC